MRRVVLIAGGGSSSHIYPGLRVAEELKARSVEVHWLGAESGIEKIVVGERGIDLTLVDINDVQEINWAAVGRVMEALPRVVMEAIALILKLRPFAVLGVGGLVSAAGLIAAGMLGVPLILQEHNAQPSRMNSTMAPWADLVCCGFAATVSHFPSAEWTGIPVRGEFFEIDPVVAKPSPRILVLGGSQGSLFLNRVVPRALAELKNDGVLVSVLHQAGTRWPEVVRTSYHDLGLEADVVALISEPWKEFAEADLIISRSGPLTVAELAAAGRGAILVPFARAVGNYQAYNARAIAESGGAIMLTEREATSATLAEVLTGVFREHNRLETLGANARTMARDGAASRIASAVMAVGGVT